jgi:hypothetical protein
VRLVTESGRVLDHRLFERELADISPVALYGALRPVIAVTIDYSIGLGSYAGPITRFAESSGGRLVWLSSYGSASDKPEELRVMDSLKTAWHTVTRPGGGLDILEVRCRPQSDSGASAHPTSNDVTFVVVYLRYTFDGSRWLKKVRQRVGYWESDDSFPTEGEFPK